MSVFRHIPLTRLYCRSRLVYYGRKCGATITPHQLRHSCASLLLNAGAPILTVQTLLGHRHIDTTLGYTRLYDGTVAADYYRAMAQIENRLNLPENQAISPPSPGELVALVDSLRSGMLNEQQAEAVRDLHGHFAPNTVTRAGEVWRRLVTDPAPPWRIAAIGVITRDESQALIEMVVQRALDDPVADVRACAQNCLRWEAPTITSEQAADFILTRLEQQVRDFRQTDGYLPELLRKCLNGLARKGQPLPAEIVSRALALLRPVLAKARPTDGNIVPLLAVLAHPAFVETAGDVERLLGQAEDAEVERHGLDTLIAMRAPGLFDILVRLSRASRWPEIRGRTSRYLAEATGYQTLFSLPGELRHVVYRAAALRDVRFLRERFRQKVVFANGAWGWI